MYRGNLSYDQLRRYLSALSDQQLIHRSDSGRFQITPAGKKALKKTSSVVRNLRDLRRELETTAAMVTL
jgi:predicted transcriptional regulator